MKYLLPEKLLEDFAMSFIENVWRPRNSVSNVTGGVENPIGGDGEKRPPPLIFSHFTIVFHADPVAGVSPEATKAAIENVRQRAELEKSGLMEGLQALNNAMRETDKVLRARLEKVQRENDTAVMAAKINRP